MSEELGIGSQIELLGRLADSYVFASNFVVTPWVAAISTEPHWRPHDQEVQAVLELPLEVLLAEDSVGEMTVERGPLVFRAPCLRAGSACIWGATSVILGELAQDIGALVDVLEARRAQRVALATQLVGPQPSMERVFALLKPEPRARVEQDWAELEARVQTAREMGRRNAELLAEQYTIMQRVLHGDDQTYEPV